LTGGLHSVVAKKEFIGDCILIPFHAGGLQNGMKKIGNQELVWCSSCWGPCSK